MIVRLNGVLLIFFIFSTNYNFFKFGTTGLFMSSQKLFALKQNTRLLWMGFSFNGFTLMSGSRPNRQCLDLEEEGFNLITCGAHEVLRGPALNAESTALLAGCRMRDAPSCSSYNISESLESFHYKKH